MLSKMDYVVRATPRPAQAKKLRTVYLQALCTHNQQIFKKSEEAEFFAELCLVFSIFFRNFEIAFWSSYKPKTYSHKKEIRWQGPAPRQKKIENSVLASSMHSQPANFLNILKMQNFSQYCIQYLAYFTGILELWCRCYVG